MDKKSISLTTKQTLNLCRSDKLNYMEHSNNINLINNFNTFKNMEAFHKRDLSILNLLDIHLQNAKSMNNGNSQNVSNDKLINHPDSNSISDEVNLQISDITEGILSRLLEQIRPVRFTELAGVRDDQMIKPKHQITLVIRQIREIANENNSGFMVDDGQIYVYTGTFWLFANNASLRKFLGEAAAKLGVNSLEAEYHSYRETLLKQLTEVIPEPPKEKKDEILINLINGTLHISGSGKIEIRPFEKEDYLKYQLDYRYDEYAECPLFHKFMNHIMPDEDVQKVLRQFIGSAFIKDTNYQKTLWLVGKGGNGKSTFLQIITALIGKTNVTNYSPEQLTQPNSYERGEIAGKLLNLSDEMGGNIGIPIFKSMVCGEPIPTRRIYEKPFTMYDYPKMIANINKLPKRIETTDAFYRRLLIVPFEIQITDEKLNYDIAKEIIENELSGVLVWVIEGIKEIVEQKGFTKSKLIEDAVKKYRLDTDNISSFIDEESYLFDRTNKILLKNLYSEYCEYCKDRGFNKYDYTDFSSKLRDLGFESKRESSGTYFLIKKDS